MSTLPEDKRLTIAGQRKLMEWLTYCKSIGWEGKESMQRLSELWLEFHDEHGKLVQHGK